MTGRGVVVGIDPGATGGIGVVDAKTGRFIEGKLLPYVEISRKMSLPDVRELTGFLVTLDITYDVEAVIVEQVSAMPGQGVSSMFKFGAGYGALLAVVLLQGLPLHLVTPSKWKREMNLAANKALSLGTARRLWPDAPLTRKKDEGLAEALLLADWWRTHRGSR